MLIKTYPSGRRRCYDERDGKLHPVKCPPRGDGPARKPRGAAKKKRTEQHDQLENKLITSVRSSKIPRAYSHAWQAASKAIVGKLTRVLALDVHNNLTNAAFFTTRYEAIKAAGKVDHGFDGANEQLLHKILTDMAVDPPDAFVLKGGNGKIFMHLDSLDYADSILATKSYSLSKHGGKNYLTHAELATHIMSHELGHVVDKNNRYSNNTEFMEAWVRELRGNQLTEYATLNPSEGFAEFFRAAYCGHVPLKKLEQSFPQTYEFFRRKGLLPV